MTNSILLALVKAIRVSMRMNDDFDGIGLMFRGDIGNSSPNGVIDHLINILIEIYPKFQDEDKLDSLYRALESEISDMGVIDAMEHI